MTDHITIHRALLEQALDALGAAKNGLLWYGDTYPDATNDSDDEAMVKIDSALETLRAELAKPVEQAEPVAWLYSVPGHRSSASCERIPLDMTPRGTAEAPLYLHPPAPAQHDAPKIQCWCEKCRPIVRSDMRMVLCPVCGNKRCPKATDHRNACTGSNEPGQPGSSYPAQHDAPEAIALKAERDELFEALKDIADAGDEAWGSGRPCVRNAFAAIDKAGGKAT